MTTARTALRATAVLGATAALTFAGAGAAAATTATSTVEGSTVSVEFALESGQGFDTCAAFITPTLGAAEILAAFAGATGTGGLANVIETLSKQEGFIPLTRDGLIVNSPVVALDALSSRTETVSASDVPSGLYTQVSVCLSTLSDPSINPALLVGNPLEVALGSLGAMSSGEGAGLDTLSSVIGGGEGEGLINLDTLSAAAGETEN